MPQKHCVCIKVDQYKLINGIMKLKQIQGGMNHLCSPCLNTLGSISSSPSYSKLKEVVQILGSRMARPITRTKSEAIHGPYNYRILSLGVIGPANTKAGDTPCFDQH